MKINRHAASLGLSALLLAFTALAIGATQPSETPAGRFLVTATGGGGVLLVDTATGQTWDQNDGAFAQPKLAAAQATSADPGRFQAIGTGGGVVLVDTATGQTWDQNNGSLARAKLPAGKP